jgi:aryl-alcohol dehydrogenase-like predicted oxidoreductase
MKTRVFPKMGWEISEISLGCWGLGGQYGEVDRPTAIATVQAALDAGINLFDTADTYGVEPGTSEVFVGEALRRVRSEVFLASKVGNWARRQGHPFTYSHPLHIVACCDASLFRLKTETIDLYQCHISGLEEPDVFLEAFEQLRQAGKIRAYGISTHRLDVLERFNRAGGCFSCQLDYSLVNRAPEKDILPYCRENQIATLIRGPLAQGLLTGKYDENTRFDDEIRAKWNESPGREEYLEKLRLMRSYQDLATGRSWTDAALMAILKHPAVTTVIPGAKSPDQVRDHVRASSLEFTPEEKTRLDPG